MFDLLLVASTSLLSFDSDIWEIQKEDRISPSGDQPKGHVALGNVRSRRDPQWLTGDSEKVVQTSDKLALIAAALRSGRRGCRRRNLQCKAIPTSGKAGEDALLHPTREKLREQISRVAVESLAA
jgi:hypothetical protein